VEENGNKISLGLFGGVLVAFLLPFATFSCQAVELATQSGYDLAMGKDVRPEIADNLSAALRDSSSAVEADSTASAREMEMDPNLFALAALGFAVIGIGLGVGADRRRAAATAAVAAAGALSLMVLKSNVAGNFRDLIRESQDASRGAANPDPMAEAMAQGMFGVEMKEGWLLALALFIAAAALNAWLYTRKPDAPAYASPAPAAPPPYTTTTQS
jgi:hypothetical protein